MGCFISKPHIQVKYIPSIKHQISNPNDNTLLNNSSKVNELMYSWSKKQKSQLNSLLPLENKMNYHKKVSIQLFYYVRSENPIFSYLKKLIYGYKTIQTLMMTIVNSDTTVANQTQEKMNLFLTQMKANIINEQKKIIKLNILRKYINQFNHLGHRLATLFNAEIELELIRLRKPYNNSNILVQNLSVESYKTRFIKLISNLYYKIPFKKNLSTNNNNYSHYNFNLDKFDHKPISIANENISNSMTNILQEIQYSSSNVNNTVTEQVQLKKRNLSLNTKNNYSFYSYLTGMNAKLGGRTFKQRIVPRMTQTRIQKGTSNKSKVLYFDKARFLNKTKKGAYTFTVKIGHIF